MFVPLMAGFKLIVNPCKAPCNVVFERCMSIKFFHETVCTILGMYWLNWNTIFRTMFSPCCTAIVLPYPRTYKPNTGSREPFTFWSYLKPTAVIPRAYKAEGCSVSRGSIQRRLEVEMLILYFSDGWSLLQHIFLASFTWILHNLLWKQIRM